MEETVINMGNGRIYHPSDEEIEQIHDGTLSRIRIRMTDKYQRKPYYKIHKNRLYFVDALSKEAVKTPYCGGDIITMCEQYKPSMSWAEWESKPRSHRYSVISSGPIRDGDLFWCLEIVNSNK